MTALTIASFLGFTGLVGFLTWYLTRRQEHESSQGFFLAGRSLSFPLIAGSLLLTNLSTEQLVGLNGGAFQDGFCVMVWEVVAVVALVAMALFFLPRFLKSGVTTVPEFLEIRFKSSTRDLTSLIFLVAYVGILLPIILYSGATGMIGILNLTEVLGVDHTTALWIVVCTVGVIGSAYALVGGLRTVAVSDTLNGVGLFVGGFLITGFALAELGGGDGISAGFSRLVEDQGKRFNSIGGPESSVPFGSVFSGIFLLNLFYWTTNQQIIQRTFGASSLAEGQKGVLLTGAFKLLGPIYLVLPGMIAWTMFHGEGLKADHAYGRLVNTVLPNYLTGFFAAAVLGAVLSSFNSALNSSCTLFSLGVYKRLLRRNADDVQVVRSGRVFGLIVAIAAVAIAPFLAQLDSLFGYLQKMNALYFVPIFSVVLVGMLVPRVPAFAANTALLVGVVVISVGYFVPPFDRVVENLTDFIFIGIVFCWLVVLMIVLTAIKPRETEWVQEDAGLVDGTPWRWARVCGLLLLATVVTIYVVWADFSVFPSIDK